MRRALLVPAILLPLIVLAAVSAGANKLIETTNFSAVTGLSYINAAQCAGDAATNPLNVEFNVPGANSGSFSLFASDTAPAATAPSTVVLCAEKTTQTPAVNAGPVGDTLQASSVKDVAVSGSDVVKAAGKTCAAGDGTDIWICAHLTNGQGAKDVASATGQFRLQFAAPAAATGVSVGSGDSKLRVSWTASSGGGTSADHYTAAAFVPGQSPIVTPQHPAADTPVATSTVTGTSTTITGLTNGKPYDVFVTAFSIGGNPGIPAGPERGIPNPSADFWDVYKDRGGVEQGGCTSGSAGTLALLAVASVLALRRRKS